MRIENPKEAILALQTYLYELGLAWEWLPKVYPSGSYGEQTKAAVKEVQRRYDLPITGRADYKTWTQIYAAYQEALEKRLVSPIPSAPKEDFPLKIGTRGYSVVMLRATLNALAEYYPTLPRLAPASLYQYSTAAAVRKLQEIYRLEPTGEVTIPLWNLLFADLASKERGRRQKPQNKITLPNR